MSPPVAPRSRRFEMKPPIYFATQGGLRGSRNSEGGAMNVRSKAMPA